MIEFENVGFYYDANPEQNSISDILFKISDGECVLLTGSSGCGKSTLLRLLNGLIPEFYSGKRTGVIRIDGEEISGKGIYDFAGYIGTVFQNPRSQFFNVDTTSEIAFGPENLAVPEAEILSRIEETVRSFHIEEVVDRDIFELSGGEKQKIACASVDVLKAPLILLDEPSANLDYELAERLRLMISTWKQEGKTIMKDAPVIILDEATSNVDPENERELMMAIDELTKEKTILMIAHRLKTVRNADRIFVIDKGKIVQCGKHDELMQQDGIYRRFVDSRRQAIGWKIG